MLTLNAFSALHLAEVIEQHSTELHQAADRTRRAQAFASLGQLLGQPHLPQPLIITAHEFSDAAVEVQLHSTDDLILWGGHLGIDPTTHERAWGQPDYARREFTTDSGVLVVGPWEAHQDRTPAPVPA